MDSCGTLWGMRKCARQAVCLRDESLIPSRLLADELGLFGLGLMLIHQADERTPLWALRPAHQPHAGLMGHPICLLCVTANAGSNNIFPSGATTLITGDYVVKIQVALVVMPAAVLAGVVVAVEDIAAVEFDFLAWHPVIFAQKHHRWNAQAHFDGLYGVVV